MYLKFFNLLCWLFSTNFHLFIQRIFIECCQQAMYYPRYGENQRPVFLNSWKIHPIIPPVILLMSDKEIPRERFQGGLKKSLKAMTRGKKEHLTEANKRCWVSKMRPFHSLIQSLNKSHSSAQGFSCTWILQWMEASGFPLLPPLG